MSIEDIFTTVLPLYDNRNIYMISKACSQTTPQSTLVSEIYGAHSELNLWSRLNLYQPWVLWNITLYCIISGTQLIWFNTQTCMLFPHFSVRMDTNISTYFRPKFLPTHGDNQLNVQSVVWMPGSISHVPSTDYIDQRRPDIFLPNVAMVISVWCRLGNTNDTIIGAWKECKP